MQSRELGRTSSRAYLGHALSCVTAYCSWLAAQVETSLDVHKTATKPTSGIGILFQDSVYELITLIPCIDAYVKLFHHCICSSLVLLVFGLRLRL